MFLSVCYGKGIALGTSDIQRVKQENTSLFVKFPLQRMAKKKKKTTKSCHSLGIMIWHFQKFSGS